MSEEKTNLIMTEKPYIKEHFPLLAEIDSPADLKKLTVEQLPQVCDELRRFILQYYTPWKGKGNFSHI